MDHSLLHTLLEAESHELAAQVLGRGLSVVTLAPDLDRDPGVLTDLLLAIEILERTDRRRAQIALSTAAWLADRQGGVAMRIMAAYTPMSRGLRVHAHLGDPNHLYR